MKSNKKQKVIENRAIQVKEGVEHDQQQKQKSKKQQ